MRGESSPPKGIEVTLLANHPNRGAGDPFCTGLKSDPEDSSDAEVQTIALHRIPSADAGLCSSPGRRCVGKTTCYEIGRIIHSRRPLYFSEHPDDLPLHVPDLHVVDSITLAQGVLGKGLKAAGRCMSMVGFVAKRAHS